MFSVNMLKNQACMIRRCLILMCQMNIYFIGLMMVLFPFVLSGCALIEELSKEEPSTVASKIKGKNSSESLLVPPPSYYSTEKSRHLGERYNSNLENILAHIVQDPVTQPLQFADTTLSIKSIGFFTHAASKSLDERYLEVILWVPDVFDDKMGLNFKVHRLFSKYGSALLNILSNDSEIYNDKRVAGFGLNFSWRSTLASGISLDRVVVYLTKDEVRKFLNEQTNEQEILTGSVIFSMQGGGAGRRVHYSLAETKPEIHPLAASLHSEGIEDIRQPNQRMDKEKGRLKSKVMQGYILQLSFSEIAEAERWSDHLKLRGYSTSINLVEGSELIHLRVGSFRSFTAAAKFFAPLRKENLTGYVILIP